MKENKTNNSNSTSKAEQEANYFKQIDPKHLQEQYLQHHIRSVPVQSYRLLQQCFHPCYQDIKFNQSQQLSDQKIDYVLTLEQLYPGQDTIEYTPPSTNSSETMDQLSDTATTKNADDAFEFTTQNNSEYERRSFSKLPSDYSNAYSVNSEEDNEYVLINKNGDDTSKKPLPTTQYRKVHVKEYELQALPSSSSPTHMFEQQMQGLLNPSIQDDNVIEEERKTLSCELEADSNSINVIVEEGNDKYLSNAAKQKQQYQEINDLESMQSQSLPQKNEEIKLQSDYFNNKGGRVSHFVNKTARVDLAKKTLDNTNIDKLIFNQRQEQHRIDIKETEGLFDSIDLYQKYQSRKIRQQNNLRLLQKRIDDQFVNFDTIQLNKGKNNLNEEVTDKTYKISLWRVCGPTENFSGNRELLSSTLIRTSKNIKVCKNRFFFSHDGQLIFMMLETQSEAGINSLFDIVVLNSQTLKEVKNVQFSIKDLKIKTEDIKNDPQMVLYKKGASAETSLDSGQYALILMVGQFVQLVFSEQEKQESIQENAIKFYLNIESQSDKYSQQYQIQSINLGSQDESDGTIILITKQLTITQNAQKESLIESNQANQTAKQKIEEQNQDVLICVFTCKIKELVEKALRNEYIIFSKNDRALINSSRITNKQFLKFTEDSSSQTFQSYFQSQLQLRKEMDPYNQVNQPFASTSTNIIIKQSLNFKDKGLVIVIENNSIDTDEINPQFNQYNRYRSNEKSLKKYFLIYIRKTQLLKEKFLENLIVIPSGEIYIQKNSALYDNSGLVFLPAQLTLHSFMRKQSHQSQSQIIEAITLDVHLKILCPYNYFPSKEHLFAQFLSGSYSIRYSFYTLTVINA